MKTSNITQKYRLGVLAAVVVGTAFLSTSCAAAGTGLGSLPGRHLDPPWWEAVQQTTNGRESTYVIPADVLFASGSSVVDESGQRTLLALLPQLATASSIRIIGCTDHVGGTDSPANVRLGEERAQAAAAILTRAGVPASKTHEYSWADTHPVLVSPGVDEATTNALDRRIVIIVTKGAVR